METFKYFMIPIEVVASMGLLHDGFTVMQAGSRKQPAFTFESVQETAQGWLCLLIEPEPRVCMYKVNLLYEIFVGGRLYPTHVKLPYSIKDGNLYVRISRCHPDAESLARSGWGQAVSLESNMFFIPIEVVASMGLLHDGETVSNWVRITDLVVDGKLEINDYHALASAGIVVLQMPLFTFESVQETAQGWVCRSAEPDTRAWVHSLSFLRELFQ